MDNTGRVGNVSAGSGVATSDGGEGGGGNSGDSYGVGDVGDTVASGVAVGVGGSIATIEAGVGGSGVTSVAVSSVQESGISVGVSLDESSKANLKYFFIRPLNPCCSDFRLDTFYSQFKSLSRTTKAILYMLQC